MRNGLGSSIRREKSTHVLHGIRPWFKGDKWISTARDPSKLLEYAQPGQRLVRIDLNKSRDSIVDVVDLSKQSVRDSVLTGPRSKGYATDSSEVLVEGTIKPEAIQPTSFEELGLR